MSLKIAYLVMGHKNVGQIARLVEQLDCDDAIFAIHIDKKSTSDVYDKLKSTLRAKKNAIFLERICISYAGWSQCRVVFSALNRLCADNLQWDYFINLSGQDYPIKPIGYIQEWLEKHRGANFIDARPIDTLKPRLRGTVRRRYQWLAIEFPGRVRRFPIPLSPFNHFQIRYYGSAWYIISRELCNWLIKSDAEVRISRRFRHTHSPDEFFMQDLIMASPYAETVVSEDRRFHIFRGQHPIILTMDHYETLMQSKALFARKFDPKVDEEIIGTISRSIS